MDNRESFLSKNPVYHAQCRRSYTRVFYQVPPISVPSADAEDTSFRLSTRSCTSDLSRDKAKCIICNKERDIKGNRKQIFVTTFNRQNEIFQKAKELDDVQILNRIQGIGNSCMDMIANDVKYHRLCMLEFLKRSKSIAKDTVPKFRDLFIKIVPKLGEFLLSRHQILTVAQIRDFLHEEANRNGVHWVESYPSSDDISKKLKEHFGDSILIIARGAKLSKYVCSSAKIIKLLNVPEESSQSSDSEDIVGGHKNSPYKLQSNSYHFAKVLKSDIELCKSSFDSIEITKECASRMIPKSLYNFISWLITDDEIRFDAEGKMILGSKQAKKTMNICQDLLYATAGIKTPKHVGLSVYVLKHTRLVMITIQQFSSSIISTFSFLGVGK